MKVLEKYCENIIDHNGIYFANEGETQISYPKDGNENCFQIETDSFWFHHRNNCIIEAVKKYAPNEVFFDIGGGNGYVSKGLEDQGITTVLVEPGIHGCVNARKRGLSNVICSTLNETMFKANTISSVGVFDVVEHIEDDELFLRTLNHLMKKEGIVFITVPAYQMLWSKEDDDAGHFKRYTINAIQNVLETSGFRPLYSTYIFSLLPIPIFIFRTIPSFLRMGRRTDAVTKHKDQHKNRKGFIGKASDKLWEFEKNIIRTGKKLSFGSSCFIVAQKTHNK